MAANDERGGPRRFQTTRWSLVLAAGGARTSESREALATLCEIYWYPLYAFLRRSGHAAESAEDLVQAYFLRLLEKDVIGQADPERGRFRSFLLASLKNFVLNEFDRARAVKRGGGKPHQSLDFTNAEGRYSLEPREPVTPEMLFEQRWALTLVSRVYDGLRRDFAQAGKSNLFDHLKGFLLGEDDDLPYSEVAGSLKMSEGAVRVAVHRLRKSFRERLREEIGNTVSEPEAVEAEVRFLKATLTSAVRPAEA